MHPLIGTKYTTALHLQYEANTAAVSAGLNVIFTGYTNGTANVIDQSLPAGTWVPRGSIIEIELRYLDGVD